MPKFLIIFLSAVLTLNAQVSSFLFAGEIINQNKVDTSTPITETESDNFVSNENLIQQTSINITNNVDPSSITRDGTTSETFSYTGSEQTFTAPSTGTYTFKLYGARGGNVTTYKPSNGALGGYAEGSLEITTGQVLYLYVGGMGADRLGNHPYPNCSVGAGGYNGGGITSSRGNSTGGGGASDIRIGGNSLNDRVIVAGGGGGGAWNSHAGGAGGGLTGGTVSYSAGGGTQSSGGSVGDTNTGCSKSAGTFGVGGNGGGWTAGGGGGGGGWYGGGGGGYNNGGGGGSSYIGGVNNGSVGQGVQNGDGYIVIEYDAAPSNTAPTATEQSVTGNEDSPQTITLVGNDVDGDALTYALATNPSNGTVSLNSGIAPINHSTADFVDPSGVNIQLSLSSTGWEGTSGWANAGIYVGPHVSVQPSGYNTPDGDGYFVRNYSGDSKSKYAITKADGNSTIQSADRGNIVFTADWAANTTLGARFVAIVDGTWYASGQFGMAANDHGNMNQTQVTDWEVDLSVNADTDNWYISLAGSPSGYEWRDGGQWSTTPISGGGLPAGNITQFGMAWLHTGNGNYGAVDNFRVINNDGGASAEVTYTPSTNYNGSDSFTFTVSDGVSTSSPATVDISITAVNDAPTISAQSASGNEDEAQEITLAGNDVDGDALTYVLATNSSNGASTLSGNVVTYTPNTNYNGSDNFTFTVSDAEYTSSAATVSITVASVNDVPVISSTPALDALDGSLYEYSLSVSDVDLDVVAITATGPNWLTVNDNILSGTPSPSDGGLHQIVLSANDGNGGVVTQSYTLAVSLHSLVITGESGYRIFSSPVSGTIYGDLLDELWTQGAEGSDSPNSNPNIWTYGNGWNSVTDFSSDALTAGKGFLMYIFADIDFDGDDDLNDPENPVIISIDGAQQESGVSVVSEPSGWNLIGNPYGLSVDISQMLSDNNGTFNSTIYALDHTNPGYKTHNGVVGNIENDEIKPFDGFWIKADADGNVFEFTEQSILKGSLNNAGRTTTDDSNGSAVFTFTNGDYSSSTYLSFTPEGQINLDPADAYRLVPMSPAEHLTSMIHESGKSLSINNLPLDLSSDISFPMDVMMLSPTEDGYETQAEQVNLSWDVTNLPAGITLELNNNITGQNINLTGYPSANINLPSKGGFSTSGDFMATYPVVGQSQFTLSVYGTLAAVEDDVLPERLTLHSAYPNPFNPSTLIRFDLSNADMVSLDIFDIAGKQVASLISEYMIPGSHQINWNPGNLSSGLYLVNLVVGTETFNQKITFIK
jgi:hypothetical protein